VHEQGRRDAVEVALGGAPLDVWHEVVLATGQVATQHVGHPHQGPVEVDPLRPGGAGSLEQPRQLGDRLVEGVHVRQHHLPEQQVHQGGPPRRRVEAAGGQDLAVGVDRDVEPLEQPRQEGGLGPELERT